MTCVKVVTPLLLLSIVSLVLGQTEPNDNRSIDEIIAESANSSHQFDFMHHPDSQTVVKELDMVFPIEQWNEILRANSSGEHRSRQKRKGIRFGNGGNRWTGNSVPYEIAPGVFDSGQRNQIMAALQDWMRYTCITFRPATFSDRNKIRFQNGGGCYSNVGMIGGSQTVGLAWSCRVKSVIIHEVGHAIGFHHEQTRPDRDNYVRINYQNIPNGVRFNFQRYTSNVINDHGVPYDYYSIMHYGGKAFSSTGGYTIVTKDSRYQNVIGRQKGHSFRDIKLANKMYNCAARCSLQDRDCPGEGFVGKDCRCWCPGSPYTLCDGGTGNRRTTAPPPTTSTTPQPVTEAPTGCRDSNNQCPGWARRGECTNNPNYMRNYCKLSCNTCGGGGGGGGGGGQCLDRVNTCPYWAGQGHCTSSFRIYMGTNCRRSCNLCSGTPTTRPTTRRPPTGNCRDRHGFCRSWATSGECSKNPAYMRQMCQQSCRVC